MLLFYFWTEEQKNRSHNCYGICISHISLPRTFKFVCKGSITNKRQSCAFDTFPLLIQLVYVLVSKDFSPYDYKIIKKKILCAMNKTECLAVV